MDAWHNVSYSPQVHPFLSPSPSLSVPPFSLQVSCFFLQITQGVQLVFTICAWSWVYSLFHGNPSKKNGSPSCSDQKLSLSLQLLLGLQSPSPLRDEFLSGLILYRSCVGHQDLFEFMCRDQEDSIPQYYPHPCLLHSHKHTHTHTYTHTNTHTNTYTHIHKHTHTHTHLERERDRETETETEREREIETETLTFFLLPFLQCSLQSWGWGVLLAKMGQRYAVVVPSTAEYPQLLIYSTVNSHESHLALPASHHKKNLSVEKFLWDLWGRCFEISFWHITLLEEILQRRSLLTDTL